MKTFKLKSLHILEGRENEIKEHPIELLDGLIINREDEKGQWLVEAFIEQDYEELFRCLERTNEEIMIEVKITKESNDPATFITTIIGINEIGDCMNVLLIGTMVDKRKHIIEDLLRDLIADGYKGKELLERFKERV